MLDTGDFKGGRRNLELSVPFKLPRFTKQIWKNRESISQIWRETVLIKDIYINQVYANKNNKILILII